MQHVTKLIIPVAGLGTRLRPLTHITPKEMVRLVDKPIFYYLLLEASLAGISEVIFILHKERKDLRHFLESDDAKELLQTFLGMKFHFVETSDRFGDGHAILEAQKFLSPNESFAVTMGDLLALPGESPLSELKKIYTKSSVPVISVEKIKRSQSGQFGVIFPKKGGTKGRLHGVSGIVEKPLPKEAPSLLAMKGKYILTPEIFPYLEKGMKNRQGEVKLAHALHEYAVNNPLHAYECVGAHYDTGTIHDLLRTETVFSKAYFKKKKKT